MKKSIVGLMALISLSVLANPSFTILNEIAPVEVTANNLNTFFQVNDRQMIEVGYGNDTQAKILMGYLPETKKCGIRYTSSSNTFSFLQVIEDDNLCSAIFSGLKQTMKVENCPVIFKVDTNKKEITEIINSCDYRADLGSHAAV